MDIDKIEDADLPAIIDPILSEPSNYKLRTKFSKCSTDRGITITNKYLSVSPEVCDWCDSVVRADSRDQNPFSTDRWKKKWMVLRI
jgi:hypothetical protein